MGCTTDIERRLRQHNGEIVGGARSTRSGAPNWRLHVYLSGFASRGEAMRWEKIIKTRARGLARRAEAMLSIHWGTCPEYRSRPVYPVPKGLDIYIELPHHLTWGD